jgi:hypothetical protein
MAIRLAGMGVAVSARSKLGFSVREEVRPQRMSVSLLLAL